MLIPWKFFIKREMKTIPSINQMTPELIKSISFPAAGPRDDRTIAWSEPHSSSLCLYNLTGAILHRNPLFRLALTQMMSLLSTQQPWVLLAADSLPSSLFYDAIFHHVPLTAIISQKEAISRQNIRLSVCSVLTRPAHPWMVYNTVCQKIKLR